MVDENGKGGGLKWYIKKGCYVRNRSTKKKKIDPMKQEFFGGEVDRRGRGKEEKVREKT